MPRMRLNQIKLSGFKSFAEPTTFQLPGQRVGVVGPNGCGKSNIMDAVRWVLGESKASELRGESMQDVIFNGSGQRKPASRASVELVFSNEDARAGGQWNQPSEIAVKRVLTRDGTSSYFINNQPVRRRDVQDVFLGTGLGPRAYAIIGQGTISRIIESRPEELRLFLEEAAGVSKYKERRRETENRLKDTRENLTRVDDILRELNNNLDKLEKQAEVATVPRAAGPGHAQAAPAVVPEAPRRGAGRSACSRRPPRPPPRWKRGWPSCATSKPNWRRAPGALRRQRRAARWRRARWPRRRWK
jgi:chromosome segregation protein